MNPVNRLLCSALWVALTLPAISARAAPVLLPPGWATGGIANVAVFGDIEVLSGPVVPGITTVSNAVSSASIQAALLPSPTLTASAFGFDMTAPSGGGAAFVQGVLVYFGRVNTPDGLLAPDTIGVSSNGSLFSTAPTVPGTNGGSDSRAKLEVNGTVAVNAISNVATNNGNFAVTTTVPITLNQTFAIELFVRSWTFEPGASAVTLLDPLFVLTPEQIAAGFTFDISAGAGNLPPDPVPLPVALPLLASALGILFSSRCGRRPEAA